MIPHLLSWAYNQIGKLIDKDVGEIIMTSKHVKNGTNLAEALSLPVAEGRFHIDGTFYQKPGAFPCAFFDQRGYIIVDSFQLLESIANVSGEKVNFQKQLSRTRGYVVGENWRDWPEMANRRGEKKAKMAKAVTGLIGVLEPVS